MAIPLSRPGAYIATAIDEIAGDPVATTGAVLSAGEELRPTGTDRGLLTRVAEITGGQVRDTLAGIYKERSAKRFAYTSLVPPLLLLSAFALLIGVAARKLALPERISALPNRLRSRLRDRDARREERSAEEKAQATSATTTLGALRGRKLERQAELSRAPPVVTDLPPPSGPPLHPVAPPLPAVFSLLLAGAWAVGGAAGLGDDVTLLALRLLCAGLAALLLYGLARLVWAAWAALAVGAVWAVYPFALWITKQPNSEVPFIPLFFATLLVFWLAVLRRPRVWPLYLLAGALAGAAMLVLSLIHISEPTRPY